MIHPRKALGHGISEGDTITIKIGRGVQHTVRMESNNSGMWFGLGWGSIRRKYLK